MAAPLIPAPVGHPYPFGQSSDMSFPAYDSSLLATHRGIRGLPRNSFTGFALRHNVDYELLEDELGKGNKSA